MIRSLKTVRTAAAALSCDTCPIIPGKAGPIEPFSAACFGSSPEVWETVDNYFERAFRWDMGTLAGRSYSPGDVDDAVSLARWLLWTTTGETWQRLGIGYGDRYRAILAVRARLRRMRWRDRFANHGGRKAVRKYRSYVASMSLSAPSPVAVAIAAELAERRGVSGSVAGRGRPRKETKIVSANVARIAIVGEPMAEVVFEGVAVSGGIVNRETDGQIQRVPVRTVVFQFHTGERIDGRWIPDGGTETVEAAETRYKMVAGHTREEYPRTFVPHAIDAGTELDRHVSTPVPGPSPWSEETRETRTTYRPTGTVAYAADVETYRERLREYYGD